MSLEALYQGIDIGNALVIVGVAVEETPLLLRFATLVKEGLVEKRSRTGAISWLRERKKAAESIGFVMLLVGLVIENGYEGAARTSVDNARGASERVILRLTSRATDAEGKIADAKRDAAKANLEAQRIKASVKWRTITDEQCGKLADALIGKFRFFKVEFPLGDPESLEYAQSLRMCLLGRVHVVPILVPIQVTHLETDIRFVGDNSSSVATIRAAFTAAQISIGAGDLPTTSFGVPFGSFVAAVPPDVTIFVGSRPVF